MWLDFLSLGWWHTLRDASRLKYTRATKWSWSPGLMFVEVDGLLTYINISSLETSSYLVHFIYE